MPYPETMVAAIRQDLVRIGFTELRPRGGVDAVLAQEKRTTLPAGNSVCGCAADLRAAFAEHHPGTRE